MIHKHTPIRKQLTYLISGLVLLLSIVSCRQNPVIQSEENGVLSFYCASQSLRQQGTAGAAPISLDGSGVEDVENPRLEFERKLQATSAQVAYPKVTDGQEFPWAQSMPVDLGTHQVGFYSAEEEPVLVAETQIEILPDMVSRLFISDSLGTYHTLFIQDQGRADAREARLRITHLSPDVGPLELVLNNEPVIPDPLTYRSSTGLLTFDLPVNTPDTLMRLQMKTPGQDSTVIGRTNLTLKPGETGHVVIQGYYREATYDDPISGEPITIGQGFMVSAFRYN